MTYFLIHISSSCNFADLKGNSLDILYTRKASLSYDTFNVLEDTKRICPLGAWELN